MKDKPLFVIKKNLQKTAQTGITFQSQLNDTILKDICKKITGRTDYDCQYVDDDYSDDVLSNTYNKGRLAILRDGEYVHFITFSEQNIRGRNQAFKVYRRHLTCFTCVPEKRKKSTTTSSVRMEIQQPIIICLSIDL